MDNLRPTTFAPSEQKTSNFNDYYTSSIMEPTGYEYVPILKPAGYIIGDPVTLPDSKVFGAPVVESRYAGSRGNSRIVYGPNTIVHEHPSRASRSPSPIKTNPNAGIVPHTNFIYNSSGQSTSEFHTNTRIVSHSPAKHQNTIISSVLTPPNHINQMTSVSNISNNNVVSKMQYDLCVAECKNWEKKYDELYEKFLEKGNFSNGNMGINEQEFEFLKRENKKLKERIQNLEVNKNKLISNFENNISKLINQYQESTLKECMLLTDRFRLEKKIEQNS